LVPFFQSRSVFI